jgi:hypothetical protein
MGRPAHDNAARSLETAGTSKKWNRAPIGTTFPDLRPVGEQIHPAPSSRVARWLRCGGSHRWAGESLVLRQRGLRRLAFACSPRTSFPACLGTPRCVLSARATDARELLLSRAREQQVKVDVAKQANVGSHCRLLLEVRRRCARHYAHDVGRPGGRSPVARLPRSDCLPRRDR